MINKNNSVKPYKIYQPWQRSFNHSESRCVDPTCNGPTIRSYTATKKHWLKQNIFIYVLRSKRSSGIFRFFTLAQFHSEFSYILNITESHNYFNVWVIFWLILHILFWHICSNQVHDVNSWILKKKTMCLRVSDSWFFNFYQHLYW